MQFKIFIILIGILLIMSLWAVYLIVQYLKTAKFFSDQKQKILNDIILLADINTVLVMYLPKNSTSSSSSKQSNFAEFKQALVLKNTLWKTRKQDFNQLWEISLPLLSEITNNQQRIQKQPKSFYKKINTTKDMLYEHVHEYNEGILSIAKKNSKKFYRLVNKLFGSKEITELPLLKIDFD